MFVDERVKCRPLVIDAKNTETSRSHQRRRRRRLAIRKVSAIGPKSRLYVGFSPFAIQRPVSFDPVDPAMLILSKHSRPFQISAVSTS